MAPSEVPVETPEQRKPGINPRVTPIELPIETQEKRKPGIPPRVAPSKVPMITQEEINHMEPTIPIATHNMTTKIEYEPLTWYLVNTVIDTDTRDILQYKDTIQSKGKKSNRPLAKRIIKGIWTTCRQISRKIEKVTNTIRFVAKNKIHVRCTITYSHIIVDVQRHKEDTIIVKIALGGHRIEYTGKVTTKKADLTTFKIHINSVSTQGERYAGWDIGNYYLETPMG